MNIVANGKDEYGNIGWGELGRLKQIRSARLALRQCYSRLALAVTRSDLVLCLPQTGSHALCPSRLHFLIYHRILSLSLNIASRIKRTFLKLRRPLSKLS